MCSLAARKLKALCRALSAFSFELWAALCFVRCQWAANALEMHTRPSLWSGQSIDWSTPTCWQFDNRAEWPFPSAFPFLPPPRLAAAPLGLRVPVGLLGRPHRPQRRLAGGRAPTEDKWRPTSCCRRVLAPTLVRGRPMHRRVRLPRVSIDFWRRPFALLCAGRAHARQPPTTVSGRRADLSPRRIL